VTAVLEAPVAVPVLAVPEPSEVCLICDNRFPLSVLAAGECVTCTCVEEAAWKRRSDR
jgi:hypothetical protein